MGSLILVSFIGLILATLVWIVIKVPWWAKPLVIIGAFLTVTADSYLGRKKLEKMCQEQAGVHIYETVDNVEGFEMEVSELWMRETNNTYKYIEEPSGISSGKVNRSFFIDGKYHVEKDVNSRSRYLVTTYNLDKTRKNYSIISVLITDKQDNHVLADIVYIYYYGGWVNRFISSLYASSPAGKGCAQFKNTKDQFKPISDLITNTLKPVK